MKNAVTNKSCTFSGEPAKVQDKIRLLRALSALKNIKPNPDWLKNQRNILLSEISQSGKKSRFPRLLARQAWQDLPGFLFPVFKPVLVFGVVLCLIFGSGLLTVQAVKTALSGDLLYPVKIAIENARLKVSSQEDKSKFQAELIKLRVEELSQIIEQTDNPAKKKEQIVKTVDKLQAHIISTKANLDNLNRIKEAEPQKVVEMAGIISEKASQSEEILVGAKEKLIQESPEVTEAIDAAVKEIKEASTLAAELKEGKVGTEVQMEVRETDKPEVEKFNDK